MDFKLLHEAPNEIPLAILETWIKKANETYFNGTLEYMNDHYYDMAIELLEQKDPNNSLLKQVGQNVAHEKVKLPYYMGSMNKLKTPEKINHWFKKYNTESHYVISDKLDGISGLLMGHKNGKYDLYSRGNGIIGQHINSLLKYIELPNINEDIVFRGELIISKENFEVHSEKYASARSLVNALVASKHSDFNVKLDFVVFEVINPKLNIEQQLLYSQKLGMKTVKHKIIPRDIAIEQLKDLLIIYRNESNYDIDGIIISSNKIQPRNNDKNPDYSFAFKSNGLGQVTEVLDVIWNVSKHNKIVPRVKFKPVKLNQSTVNFATGTHAKYIKDNKINKGSIIRVVLSGEVIPCIVDIIQPSSAPLMPNIDYVWNESRINIYAQTANSSLILTHFFKSLGIKGTGPGIIERLHNHGFNTINSIYNLSYEDLMKIPGFQKRSSENLLKSIDELFNRDYSVPQLAHASLCFGESMGLRKLNVVEKVYPLFHEPRHNLSLEKLNKLSGYSSLTSQKILNGMDDFRVFLENHPYLKIKNMEESAKNGKIYVFSGFRDKAYKEKLEAQGHSVQDTLTKDTDYLVVKDTSKLSSKMKKAKELGITIIDYHYP